MPLHFVLHDLFNLHISFSLIHSYVIPYLSRCLQSYEWFILLEFEFSPYFRLMKMMKERLSNKKRAGFIHGTAELYNLFVVDKSVANSFIS